MAKRTRSVVANVVPAKPAVNYGNVEFQREELTALIPSYELIRDCIAGSRAIKKRGDIYLPRPNAADKSADNLARYDAYITRAMFYNVTRRTLAGLTGQVFMQDPVIQVPSILNPVVKDANGSGVSLTQLAKQALMNVVAFGRAGVLADYPKAEGVTTRAQQLAGEIRPTITVYEPWNIINWRTITRGSKVLLSLVVLRETYDKADDGFQAEIATQYRVLRLIDNVYHVEIWREGGPSAVGFAPVPGLGNIPTDARGVALDEIPFSFIGAENNDPEPDAPPLFDLADLNIGHYRNSADYEEAAFIVGQPTPWFAGLTQEWVEDVFKGQVLLGSRAAIPLPEGGSAGLLQVQENSMPKEAMELKERQMVSLGARLVEQKSVQRTAEEAAQDKAAETSELAVMTKNTTAALQYVLEWCGIFSGAVTVREDARDASNRKINFELNTEFEIAKLSPEQIRMVIEAWQKEAITTEEMRKRMRQTGVAYLDDNAYTTWAEAEAEKAQEAMQAAGFTTPEPPEELDDPEPGDEE